MDNEDRLLFSQLLFAYKRLWLRQAEVGYLRDHAGEDPEAVHEQFFDVAEPLFRPITDALLANSPLQDALQRLVREIEHPGSG